MERIMNLSKWTKEDLILALERRGYYEDGIISAKFSGVNDRNTAMFDIAYTDTHNEGGIGFGRVFVFIDKTGELVADY